jgi:hypothetical protein
MMRVNKWAIIRTIILIYLVCGGWGGANHFGITWPAAVLIPVVIAVFGFLWLHVQVLKNKEDVEWIDAYELMNQRPT